MLAVFGANFLAVADDKDKPAKGNKPNEARTNKPEKKSAPADKPASKKIAPTEPDLDAISPQREAEAIAFAQKHHAELAELLSRLKASHPDQYAKGLRELDRTRERLEKQRERDADRFAILLREWQFDSRVRLLAARITMSNSAELETELRQVLTARHDVRLQLLTYDREKSKARVHKMDEQIAEHVQNRNVSIDREVDRIKKSAEVRKKSAKPAKRTVEKEK